MHIPNDFSTLNQVGKVFLTFSKECTFSTITLLNQLDHSNSCLHSRQCFCKDPLHSHLCKYYLRIPYLNTNNHASMKHLVSSSCRVCASQSNRLREASLFAGFTKVIWDRMRYKSLLCHVLTKYLSYCTLFIRCIHKM